MEAIKTYSRFGVMACAYVHPDVMQRMIAVRNKDRRLSFSKQLIEAIEHGVSIAQLEQRVGIKPENGKAKKVK